MNPKHRPMDLALAQAIFDAHPRLQVGPPPTWAQCHRPSDSAQPAALGDGAAAAGAMRLAARRLGFVEADAQLLARAWHAQGQRSGWDPLAWPCLPSDFGLGPWPRPQAFAPCPERLGLYAVLPNAAWVARMAAAGVATLQLRFKSSDPQAIGREVRAAVQAVHGSAALLFINDHWQAAIEAGAYGVHLGQEDMAEAPLDAIRAAGLRLGLSTHGYAELLAAEAHGPSYLALGAVFPTTLKRMATAPQGLGRLAAYAHLLKGRSLVAIGGIDAQRLAPALQAGVGSAAVVRALVEAADPEAAALALGAHFD